MKILKLNFFSLLFLNTFSNMSSLPPTPPRVTRSLPASPVKSKPQTPRKERDITELLLSNRYRVTDYGAIKLFNDYVKSEANLTNEVDKRPQDIQYINKINLNDAMKQYYGYRQHVRKNGDKFNSEYSAFQRGPFYESIMNIHEKCKILSDVELNLPISVTGWGYQPIDSDGHARHEHTYVRRMHPFEQMKFDPCDPWYDTYGYVPGYYCEKIEDKDKDKIARELEFGQKTGLDEQGRDKVMRSAPLSAAAYIIKKINYNSLLYCVQQVDNELKKEAFANVFGNSSLSILEQLSEYSSYIELAVKGQPEIINDILRIKFGIPDMKAIDHQGPNHTFTSRVFYLQHFSKGSIDEELFKKCTDRFIE